jgi:cell division protein FtsB
MSDTPRTDAAAFHTYTNGGLLSASVVTVDVAMKLERELNAAKAEVAALKAEPLSEMWSALESYQEQADAEGGGMTDTARQAWRQWWDEEGSAMRPLPNEDTEQFARRMTEIAWSNGAFKRLADVEYLCLKRVGLERELAALVAERDALKEENNALRSRQKSHQDEVLDRMFEMDALRKRVAELEAHPPAASDLRERDETLIRWMNQVTAMLCHSMTHGHDTKQELVTRCDKAIDAMRKGEE